MSTVLGLLIAAGVGAYIFLPYLLGWDEEAKERLPVVEDPREELLVQLADLEYDFRAGKLAEEDYKRLRREIEARLMRQQESEEVHGGTDGGLSPGAGEDRQGDRGA
ncbi:MAG: hypothetical protein ACE5LQ_01960 [Candidatus Bipolaricaulia bacterium]